MNCPPPMEHKPIERLTDRELQSLRNLGNEAEAAADEIVELRAALMAREAVEVPQWQPIETAPRDGSTVLVTRDMGEFGWIRGYARWEGVGHISGWVSNGFDPVMSNLGLAHPTYWQPLPASPTKGQL